MQKKRNFLFVSKRSLLLAFMVVVLIGILCESLTSCASEQTSANVSSPTPQNSDPAHQDALPDSVKVTGQSEQVLLHTHVTTGNQIYECQASTTNPSGFAWTLQAPFALLEANDGTNVIHSTGPTWLYTQDGSRVEGKVGQFTAPDGKVVPASVAPDANAIPWLRVDVTSHLGNTGLFTRVDQIQRLRTVGGTAPKDTCDHETANKHVIESVPYQADYVFWGH